MRVVRQWYLLFRIHHFLSVKDYILLNYLSQFLKLDNLLFIKVDQNIIEQLKSAMDDISVLLKQAVF